MTRVVVFIDYQNVYMRARDAFGLRSEPHWEGQIDPYAVGLALAKPGGGNTDLDLDEVRVYRGLPAARRDPQGNAACMRQISFWRGLPRVTAITRPLQYAPAGSARPPKEKGIDVQLAVDLVMGAVNDSSDYAVVFSADTDLIPALDAAAGLKGAGAVQVAAWRYEGGHGSRLKASSGRTWCHYLDRSVYDLVADRHDYNQPRH